MKLLGKMGLLLGIAVVMMCVRASSARALPGNEIDTEYYPDRHFIAPIGEYVLLCGGGHYREGQTSRFIIRYSTPCSGPGVPAEISCIADGVPTTCPLDLCNSELFTCSPVGD
jgi:hypothetical protein